jgi:hypothetical protein
MKTVFEHREFFPHDDELLVIRRAYDVLGDAIEKNPDRAAFDQKIVMTLTKEKSQKLLVQINDPDAFDWKQFWRNALWISICMAGLIYLTH